MITPARILIACVFLAGALGHPARSVAQETAFSQAELEQLLAPVALYPDTVLSHLLIAATYPLEIVQAARWTRDNPGITGEAAVAAVEPMDWDPSVKALVAFPELLQRMDQDLDWTQRLGDAFLAQEPDVLATVQALRDQAYARGYLESNEHVRVVRETEYIYIEPARPQVVYVPYYDPYVVYGDWRWPAYPPHYWHHPPGFSLSLGFYWGSGFHVAPSFYFSAFQWPLHQVVVLGGYYHYDYRRGYDRHRRSPPPDRYYSRHDIYNHGDAERWRHDQRHRRGVDYQRGVNYDRFRRDPGAGRGEADYRPNNGFTERGREARSRQGDQTLAARLDPARTAAQSPLRGRAQGDKQERGRHREWAAQTRETLALNGSLPGAQRPVDRRARTEDVLERAGTVNSSRLGGRDRGAITARERAAATAAPARAANGRVGNNAHRPLPPTAREVATARPPAVSTPGRTRQQAAPKIQRPETPRIERPIATPGHAVASTATPRYPAPLQRREAPRQRYEAPQQRSQVLQPRSHAPQPRYEAPQQRYQAPRPEARPEPRNYAQSESRSESRDESRSVDRAEPSSRGGGGRRGEGPGRRDR